MAVLSENYGESCKHYSDLAKQVKKSFEVSFWNEDQNVCMIV